MGCIGLMSSMVAQCVFPAYDNYGLICDEAQYLCGYELDGSYTCCGRLGQVSRFITVSVSAQGTFRILDCWI